MAFHAQILFDDVKEDFVVKFNKANAPRSTYFKGHSCLSESLTLCVMPFLPQGQSD